MDQIGNYKIIEKIGVGGMGEVYRGIDTMLERDVAIKFLKPELSSREDIVQRFKSEAVMLGRLNHPNIATVYNFGKTGDQYYMALEFAKGKPLDSQIQLDGACPWRKALEITVGILDGLAHAHGFNIVHRDIKPSNIIVNEVNAIKILDFGIGRILETARLTKTGHLIGTMEYISPEQIQGKDTDARSDIYSVGIVLYELLTGRVPFEKNTEYELIKAHVEEKPKPLSSLSGQIPVQLEHIVLKALEKKPDKRFASASDFKKSLIGLIESQDSIKVNNLDKKRWVSFCKDYPGLVFLFGLLTVSGVYIIWDTNHRKSAVPSLRVEIPEKAIITDSQQTIKVEKTEPVTEERPILSNTSKPKTLDSQPGNVISEQSPDPILSQPNEPKSIPKKDNKIAGDTTGKQNGYKKTKGSEKTAVKQNSSKNKKEKNKKELYTYRPEPVKQPPNNNWLEDFSGSGRRTK